MTISDKGKALRDIWLAIEEADKKMQVHAANLMIEMQKRDALMLCLKRLVEN